MSSMVPPTPSGIAALEELNKYPTFAYLGLYKRGMMPHSPNPFTPEFKETLQDKILGQVGVTIDPESFSLNDFKPIIVETLVEHGLDMTNKDADGVLTGGYDKENFLNEVCINTLLSEAGQENFKLVMSDVMEAYPESLGQGNPVNVIDLEADLAKFKDNNDQSFVAGEYLKMVTELKSQDQHAADYPIIYNSDNVIDLQQVEAQSPKIFVPLDPNPWKKHSDNFPPPANQISSDETPTWAQGMNVIEMPNGMKIYQSTSLTATPVLSSYGSYELDDMQVDPTSTNIQDIFTLEKGEHDNLFPEGFKEVLQDRIKLHYDEFDIDIDSTIFTLSTFRPICDDVMDEMAIDFNDLIPEISKIKTQLLIQWCLETFVDINDCRVKLTDEFGLYYQTFASTIPFTKEDIQQLYDATI